MKKFLSTLALLFISIGTAFGQVVYEVTGPTGGIQAQCSGLFTIQLDGTIPGSFQGTITPSDGAGGTFVPFQAKVGPDQSLYAYFTYKPASASVGTKTITFTSSSSLVNHSPISYIISPTSSTFTAGSATFQSSTSSTISLSLSGSPNGTPPYTYQWYVGTTAAFIPDSTNIISGATSSVYTDSPITNQFYYYKCVLTDSTSRTAITTPAGGTLGLTPLGFWFLGDSTTSQGGTTPSSYYFQQALQRWHGVRTVNIQNNGPGQMLSSGWTPGTTLYQTDKSSAIALGCTYAFYRIGTNDALNRIPPYIYVANVTATVNDLVSSGFKVFICPPLYLVPSASSPPDLDDLLVAYHTSVSNLVDNINVFFSWNDYTWVSEHQSELGADGIHQNTIGCQSIGLGDFEVFRSSILGN